MLRILFADDHIMVREALVRLLNREADLRVVAEAANGREALAQMRETMPDVAVLDWFMPVLDGLESAREMLRVKPDLAVLLISGYPDLVTVRRALAIGARGYLSKGGHPRELMLAVREVAAGRTYVSSDVADALDLDREPADRSLRVLTPRAREVLRLLAEGKSAKEIGYALGISHRTVEHHRRQLRDRLGLHDQASITRYAIRCGLIPP